jgi:hypothetical protein
MTNHHPFMRDSFSHLTKQLTNMENIYDTPMIDMIDYGDDTNCDYLWKEYNYISTSSDYEETDDYIESDY